MIECKDFYEALGNHRLTFFAGVPDSLLKEICAYITDNTDPRNNVITANEGAAIALASGYHLATGRIGIVYMQNAGQGNAVNPLTSLADPNVYSLPLLILIGWRGEPGVKDEPQHVKQGKITLSLLDTLGIPYEILPEDIEDAKKSIGKAIQSMKERSAPFALVIRKGTFGEYKLRNKIETNYELNREGALKIVTDGLNERDIIISTTGKTSRELFEYREEKGQGHEKDFLTVGSMGHSSMIAMGIAGQTGRQVYCFDGDGAVIMHMGSLGIIGHSGLKNFKHIIINNGAHDSVGGQPTVAFQIDLPAIAKACGYKEVFRAETSDEIREKMQALTASEGPSLFEIRVNKGARKDLGRPTRTPLENKRDFMGFVVD